jgi:hypothetical protein
MLGEGEREEEKSRGQAPDHAVGRVDVSKQSYPD